MQRFIKQTSSSSGRLIRICGDDKMVNITDVKQILQFAIDAEIKVFLDGGWALSNTSPLFGDEDARK